MRRYRFLVFVAVVCLSSFFVAALGQSRLGQRAAQYTGQFNSMVLDFFDEGYAETVHILTLDDGRDLEAVFQPGIEPPQPGSRATLAGRVVDGRLLVDRVLGSTMTVGGLPNSPVGEQRFVIALIRFQNDPPGNENVTIPQVQDKMFNPAYSVTDWFDEASYGKTFATGDVFGWFTLPMDRACNASQWRSLVIPMLDPLTDLTQYNRLYIMVPQAGGCTWGGLGTLGTNTFSTQDGQWTTTTSWTRSEYFNESLSNPRGAVFVTAHEVGHNFGQNHGEGMTFNNNRAMGPFNCDGCESTVTAYADAHSAMGGNWRPGHHNAEHKRNLNWFNPGNVLEVTHTGTYDIAPFENDTSDPIVLRILRGFAALGNRNEWLFGEWRQPIGYDSELNHMSNAAYNGLFMHWDYRTNTYGYNLDMTPGDNEMRNAPIPNGQNWSDLYTKLQINPVGVFGGKLRVNVTIGEPVPATALNVLRGDITGGGQAQINSSDNQFLTVRASATGSRQDPPVWVEYEAVHTGPTIGALRFELEARSNVVIRQRVQLFNWLTGVWDTVSDRDATLTDSFVEADINSNVARYVQAGTGRMRARTEWFLDRPVILFPFTINIDQARWKILR
jgi:M6 family metalloprotease-like protein